MPLFTVGELWSSGSGCVIRERQGLVHPVSSCWKYPRNLESPRVSSPGFGNDSKIMVMSVDVTAQVALELLRRMRTGIFGSYCQKKQTEHSIRPVSSATGTTVSRQTVYRRLGHIGLYARRPVRCVLLTATHCLLRLTWSRDWTPQQWSFGIFPGESRFSLQSDSRRTLIWRAPCTRYHQENTIERHRYGGAG
ncbi:HTH_Tnp_Tc3_2 domain-containing protein [Trichonephila clavipes]|nr:HTH_Tnp_Tc3_2 domain-containing protein [Trichonephila clavipes]